MDGRTWTDPTRNKYRLRLGLALLDVGAVRYQQERYVRQARIANPGTVRIGQLDTIRIDSPDDLAPTLQRLVGLTEQSRRFTSGLPTTFRLSADYRIVNHIFAGLLWTQSLRPETSVGQRTVSSLALTPRVEFGYAEIALPIVLANRYRQLQLGAMLRMGSLLVGSDNLGGLFGLTTTTGADLYLGLGFTLNKKRIKDRDKDQVSNKLDKCPKLKGPWECQGCPDQDGDGVRDTEDACPTEAGPAGNKGCPVLEQLTAPADSLHLLPADSLHLLPTSPAPDSLASPTESLAPPTDSTTSPTGQPATVAPVPPASEPAPAPTAPPAQQPPAQQTPAQQPPVPTGGRKP
ncbi:hypothetical protein D0T11_19355 [Hymenobacter rubripertinctus]|uniref:DUF5723 domain-containing protein n=2 Tax=Hymenobacter rubripertinctus TaxID=2029981 RepID=A0A418QLZ3_9BACT|nr:hypothetical protein D0T11_19355 [Hymenobacter rubripertinctus]